ncbi:MAG: DNA gyrase C-terminal beta-propeller domain-containing protein, partial [Burkholderiaceae bacterium]
ALYGAFECRTVDTLISIGTTGRVYSVPVRDLPSARGDGAPVTSMIDLESETRLVGYVAGPSSQPVLLATSNGFGFAATLGDMLSRQRAGKQFINVDAGDEPLQPQLVDAANDRLIACLSERGRVLIFDATEIKALSGGGRGVTLIDLDEGEKMLAAVPISKSGVVLKATKGSAGKPAEVHLAGAALESQRGHRARKGKLVDSKLKPPFSLLRPDIRSV